MVDHQEHFLKEAEQFVKHNIDPYATSFDRSEMLPREMIDKLAEKKYLSANLPIKYGGLELSPVNYGKFTEIIGKSCSAVRTLITVHSTLVGESISRWGTANQKDKWLPLISAGSVLGAFALSEPDTGSDAKGIQTTYRRTADGYILNGRKKWISFGGIANVFLTIAKDESSESITAFLVERESKGLCSTPISGMLAGRATHLAEIELDHVEVSAGNVLGKVGSGFTYVVNHALDHGRYSIAWAGVAIAQAALEEMVKYTRTRSQFGKKLCEFESVQTIISNATIDVEAARSYCIRAGELRGSRDPEGIMMTTMAKIFSSRVAMKVCTDAVQLHGANGLHSDFKAERLFREAKVLEIIEGNTQVLEKVVSGAVLSKYMSS